MLAIDGIILASFQRWQVSLGEFPLVLLFQALHFWPQNIGS